MARAKKVNAEIIEVNNKPTEINIDAIKAEVLDTVSKDFEKKLNALKIELGAQAEQRRERITLTGKNQYVIEADNDGLSFSKDKDFVLVVGKNGQLSTGTRSARTVGKGSAHFKAGYSSEADMPTDGLGSTRGVIVEGDGDDEKTFTLRAVSRMNRQGSNFFSDGSFALNSFTKINNSTFSVYHRFNDSDVVSLKANSKAFENTVLNIDASVPSNKRWKAISVDAETYAPEYKTNLFAVNGAGDTYTHGAYYSNNKGYAELLEWADGNTRNENRNGYTVTIDNRGKLRIADEGDVVIGVVVPNAAVIGNSAWNQWCKKYNKNHLGEKSTNDYQVIEWLDMETTILQSYFKEEIPADFALPDTAEEIQTDSNGNNFSKPVVSKGFSSSETYISRIERKGWALVCLIGIIPVYKGQTVNSSWVKVNSINDELELWLVK